MITEQHIEVMLGWPAAQIVESLSKVSTKLRAAFLKDERIFKKVKPVIAENLDDAFVAKVGEIEKRERAKKAEQRKKALSELSESALKDEQRRREILKVLDELRLSTSRETTMSLPQISARTGISLHFVKKAVYDLHKGGFLRYRTRTPLTGRGAPSKRYTTVGASKSIGDLS